MTSVFLLSLIPIAPLLAAIIFYVAKYQWKASKLPKTIPRHPTVFAVAQKLSGKPGDYEDYLEPFFNPDETAKPIMQIGPSTIGDPVVVVSEPDAIKEVLTNTALFPKYHAAYTLVGDLLGHGLVVLNGGTWKHHRKVATPLFHHQSLKLMNQAMLQISNEMVDYLKTLNGQPISSTFYQRFTMKVIIATTFGADFDADWMAQKFQDLTNAFPPYIRSAQLISRFLTHHLPFGAGPTLYNTQQDIKSVLVQKIADRRAQLKENPIEPEETSDLLTLLILNDLDDDTIVQEGLTFLFAGSDTTSYLLSWTSYFLCKFPEHQTRISQESQEALNSDGTFDEISLTKMPYLRNVLRESLRLRPPVADLARYVTRDTVLCGTNIPAGTVVAINFHLAHLSANNWKSPRNFNPDRFDSERAHAFAFVPFSAGERNCIGQKVALQEATLFVAMLVKNFEMSSDTLADVKMTLDPLIKASGLTLKFKEKSQ